MIVSITPCIVGALVGLKKNKDVDMGWKEKTAEWDTLLFRLSKSFEIGKC